MARITSWLQCIERELAGYERSSCEACGAREPWRARAITVVPEGLGAPEVYVHGARECQWEGSHCVSCRAPLDAEGAPNVLPGWRRQDKSLLDNVTVVSSGRPAPGGELVDLGQLPGA